MKFTITINSGNSAMVDFPAHALKTMLHQVITQVEDTVTPFGLAGSPLYDLNGNKVGAWEYQPEES